jgi:hypothetical protein
LQKPEALTTSGWFEVQKISHMMTDIYNRQEVVN